MTIFGPANSNKILITKKGKEFQVVFRQNWLKSHYQRHINLSCKNAMVPLFWFFKCLLTDLRAMVACLFILMLHHPYYKKRNIFGYTFEVKTKVLCQRRLKVGRGVRPFPPLTVERSYINSR